MNEKTLTERKWYQGIQERHARQGTPWHYPREGDIIDLGAGPRRVVWSDDRGVEVCHLPVCVASWFHDRHTVLRAQVIALLHWDETGQRFV